MSQQPLTIRARVEVPDYAKLTSLQDKADFEYEIRMRLAQELMPELIKVMQIHEVRSYQTTTTEYIGEIIAMKHQDWLANYAQHQHRRYGISDGTMAIMQNGNWVVVGTASESPSAPAVKMEPKPQPKKFDPSEYLKQRVSELQNGSKS